MRLNGLREPKQAFVVAHGGNVAWDDRRYRAYQVGRIGWHRISSHETRYDRAFWAIKSNWRPDRSHLCKTELHKPGSSYRHRRAKTTTNRCPAGTFRPGFKPAHSR